MGWKLRGAREFLFVCNNTTLKIHPKNFDKREEETCVGLSNKLRIDLVGASVYLSKVHRDLAQPPPRSRWFMFTKCSWKASREDKQTNSSWGKCMLVLLELPVIKKIARGHNALRVYPHCKVSIGQYNKMCTSPLIFFSSIISDDKYLKKIFDNFHFHFIFDHLSLEQS